jgi:hypothetical protein
MLLSFIAFNAVWLNIVTMRVWHAVATLSGATSAVAAAAVADQPRMFSEQSRSF